MSSQGQSSMQSSLDLQFYGEIAPFMIEGSLMIEIYLYNRKVQVHDYKKLIEFI